MERVAHSPSIERTSTGLARSCSASDSIVADFSELAKGALAQGSECIEESAKRHKNLGEFAEEESRKPEPWAVSTEMLQWVRLPHDNAGLSLGFWCLHSSSVRTQPPCACA